jgi:hypothetical protein
MDVKGAQRRNDQEIRQDERPSARPRTPEAAAQIRDVNSDLDRQRSGKRLADGDGLAHLLLSEPPAVRDELALHLADERHRPAEAEAAQAQKVEHEL